MAKKTARARTKKAAPKKTTARKQSRKAVERVLTTGPIRRRPKTPVLPGMEGMVQDQELDSICSAIADNMHIANEADETLKGLKGNGLSALRKKNRTVYKAHGVEIVRVPGDEKLRTRLVKGDGADTGEGGDDGAEVDLDNGDDSAGDESVSADA